MRALWLLAAIPACYAPNPPPGSPCDQGPCPTGLVCSPSTLRCELPGAGGDADAGDDAAPDAPVDARCFGAGLVKLCLAAAPGQPVSLDDATIDTASSPLCAPYDGTGLCVVAGTDVVIDGVVRATGARPLVLVASQRIVVVGTLDAASRRIGGSAMSAGAGAGPACAGAGTPLQKAGGPGGSFGGAGGDGGFGDGGPTTAAPRLASVTALRGGCAGTAGVGTLPGAAGPGGGAVYLIARSQIAVTGAINASGAGGGGAPSEGGGGGGGSGGLIGLEAPSIVVTGAVLANGGGGGEGGGSNPGNGGANPAGATQPAPGGAGGAPNGGDGGAGAAGASTTGGRGGNNTSSAGGGGGGGGAGIVIAAGALTAVGSISPAARAIASLREATARAHPEQ